MDLIDKIRELSVRIPKQLDYIQTEEATKNALIMPFISALGYNPFDPTEVTPELNADIGLKKGEKVDYAILLEGKPMILFECKWHGADLGKEHASQLYRYFSVTDAKFGILTNGLIYWFYTDLEAPNKMDARPFFEFNILDFRESDVEQLKKFTKSAFDLNDILTSASELKYTKEFKRILGEQLQDPSDDFVKLLVAPVYNGRITPAVREQLGPIVKRAFRQFINDQINERLKTALATETAVESLPIPETEPELTIEDSGPKIVTTEEEYEAFYIVKALLREVIDVNRIALRDRQTYCNILLDDNNRKPIFRLRFSSSQKTVGMFDNPERKETNTNIENLNDIYQFADRLKATIAFYDSK
ncbi:MAG: type I restriction enzyme HsdR N-terminal domain-containing protein [Chloroflexi bacterium]|nr:type I restriction enzyme HsdR N-terminal domain-containing protein [Chloroflexota bacterium]MBP7043015.1 type I restriction enzyme HsdR N-terminal domain-containing protein [Chloroflexota bacterium]